jgi:hypothetical protein
MTINDGENESRLCAQTSKSGRSIGFSAENALFLKERELD